MRSRIAARGLALLAWGLAVHILVIALLYGAFGVGEGTVRSLAAWKEAVVVGLFLYVCFRAPMGRGPGAWVTGTDMFVGGLAGLALVFLIGTHTIIYEQPSIKGQLFGFRDAIFFFALYFVGRATPDLADDPATLKRVVLIGVVTSLAAVIEIAFVGPELLAAAGIGSYFNDFLDIEETTAGNEYGLPDNYWSHIGGEAVRRAGSTFLTSQGFAATFLIVLAVVTWRIFADERRPTARAFLAYIVLWSGLFLSITRMTILACGVQVLAALAFKRRAGLLAAVFAIGVLTVVGAWIAKPSIGSFIWQTLSGQTGSNQSHAKDISNGVDAMLERPWGSGLGTADQTALRNGLEPLTFDNMYLKYGVELGVLGLALFLGALVSILLTAQTLARRGSTLQRRRLGGVVVLATIGVFVNGMTSNVFNSPWLAYMYCWLSGMAVTAAQDNV